MFVSRVLFFVCCVPLSLFLLCVCLCLLVFAFVPVRLCFLLCFASHLPKLTVSGTRLCCSPKKILAPEAISKPPVSFLCLTQKVRTTNVYSFSLRLSFALISESPAFVSLNISVSGPHFLDGFIFSTRLVAGVHFL